MRNRRHQPPDQPPPRPPVEPAPTAGYDWQQFGRHRLRAPGSAVVDFPVTTMAAAQVWVATLWPDPRTPGGWDRTLWHAEPTTGRGWLLPEQLAAGDVLEFGADNEEGPVRWYGIMDSYELDRWVTVQGPYPNPTAAHDAAQDLLAHERFLPALEPEPPDRDTASDARPERDRRRRHHRHP